MPSVRRPYRAYGGRGRGGEGGEVRLSVLNSAFLHCVYGLIAFSSSLLKNKTTRTMFYRPMYTPSFGALYKISEVQVFKILLLPQFSSNLK